MGSPEPRDVWGRTMGEHLASNRFHTVDNFYPYHDQGSATAAACRRIREQLDRIS